MESTKKRNPFIEEFIEIYRSNPCLWKVKSKEYSDKNKKHLAYELLAEKLREIDPAANKESVVKKINNLRSSFRKEYKKVKASQRSGTDEIYTPHLWYYDLLLFLTEQKITRDSNMTYDSEGEEIESEGNNSNEALSPPNFNQFQGELITCTPSISSCERTPKIYNKRRKDEETASSSSERIIRLIGDRYASAKIEDDFDIVGKNVASKLRQISKEQAIFAERLINEVLFEAQLGALNRQTRVMRKRKIYTKRP